MNFTDSQIERYSRHIILEEVGASGQNKLLESSVLLVGAGGLGSPAALYLAAAGIGTIGIIDPDTVDLTNLQRQVIHHTADVGTPKVDSAAAKIRALNPDVEVHTYREWARADSLPEIMARYDFVLDGTDNFAAKFLVNDAACFTGTPFSHAGILRFDGQLMTVIPRVSACYRCVFAAPPPEGAAPSCAQAGVLGVLAGVVGTLQATEAIKYILGIGDLLTNTLMTYNALQMQFRRIRLKPNPACPICGTSPTITRLHDEKGPVCDLKGTS